MRNTIIILMVLVAGLSYSLLESRSEIRRVKEREAFLRHERGIAEAIREDVPKVNVRINCHTIRIEERFGKFYKWGIDVKGLKYNASERTVVFRNEFKNGVSKSWFPPKENHEQGGPGSSVSMEEKEYRLELLNKNRVARVISHLEGIKERCN